MTILEFLRSNALHVAGIAVGAAAYLSTIAIIIKWLKSIVARLDDVDREIALTRHDRVMQARCAAIVGGCVCDLMDDRPRLKKERDGRVYDYSSGDGE